MKFYSIVQYQMAGIHAGIQTAHAVHAMYEKYLGRSEDDLGRKNLHVWAKNHQTIAILNGGGSGYIREMYTDIIVPSASDLGLPCVMFHESDMASDGMLTAVALVVPKSVYEYDPNKTWMHDRRWGNQQYLAVNRLKDLISGMRSQR